MLPEQDMKYLKERWPGHHVERQGGQVLVVLPGYRLPARFEPREVDLLLILAFGFPETKPDMFWVDPVVTVSGHAPLTADLRQEFVGRTWQRFSRHLPEGAWRRGDNLRSWVTFIGTMLEREATTGQLAA